MEALNTQKDGDPCSSNHSCHSHSSVHTVSTGGRTTATVVSARNNSSTVGREGAKKKQPSSYGGKLRAVYDGDKENESATTAMTRKVASEPGSVSGGWQRGPPAVGSSCSAPFKDRTNNRATDGNRDRSDGQKSSTTTVDKPKAKMLTELAPPLNAARLKPIHQQTRTAKVS